MKITKDLLQHLKIISILIKVKDTDKICILEKQIGQTWIIKTADNSIFQKETFVKIQINFNDFTQSYFDAKVLTSEKDFTILQLPKSFNDKKLCNTILEIENLEKKDQKFGRRKEERLKISKDKCFDFFLKSIEQEIIIGKKILPCAIIDVSLHGLCIIAPFSQFYAKDFENFKIKIDFSDCTTQTILNVHKVSARLSKTENNNFAFISCQILEPVHFEWKKHVITLLENLLE